MAVFAWIVIFLAAVIILAYKRASFIVWSIGFFVLLFLLSGLGHLSHTTLTVFWIIYAALTVIFNVHFIRRFLFTHYILTIYRKKIPYMSDTEREALMAGNVGWEAEMFSGMPDWNRLLQISPGKLSAEEQAFLQGPVEQLCAKLRDWEFNHILRDIPADIWQFIKDNGFLGLIIPKQYGGQQFSALAHSQIITKIASSCTAVATVVSVPNSLGPAELLLHYGTEQQKNYYLPRLAKGEEIPCFALTSPVAGSDASAIVDHGEVCEAEFDGKKQLAIRLNWDKRYITLSPVATLLGLAFKLYDPQQLLGKKEYIGITCALIPVDTPGVTIGRRHYPVCCVFPNGPTQGKDVLIPMDWIIGGAQMAGMGWRMLMQSLAEGRSISLPSMVAGGIKRVVHAAGAYTRIRYQFNTSISDFGGIKEALTEIGGYAYMAEALRLFTVSGVDRGEKSAVASAISKYHTTELSRKIANHGMDIHGGKGICMGPSNYITQGYIENPISITVEGANILTRTLIIFGQGAVRCHPYLYKEMMAAQDEDQRAGLIKFDRLFFAHMGMIISNCVRAWWLGVTNGYMAGVPRSSYRRYYQQFTRFCSVFACVADIAMYVMGGQLKRRERLSARLGDMLSYLYIASAVFKYTELEKDSEAAPFVHWVSQHLLYQSQMQLDSFLRNFPVRWLAFILRWLVLPRGRNLRPPNDSWGSQIVEALISFSQVRERLTQHVYKTDTPNNPVGKIDEALRKMIEVEPLIKKIKRAQRKGVIKGMGFVDLVQSAEKVDLITSQEAATLVTANELRMQIINVDDFALEELLR